MGDHEVLPGEGSFLASRKKQESFGRCATEVDPKVKEEVEANTSTSASASAVTTSPEGNTPTSCAGPPRAANLPGVIRAVVLDALDRALLVRGSATVAAVIAADRSLDKRTTEIALDRLWVAGEVVREWLDGEWRYRRRR